MLSEHEMFEKFDGGETSKQGQAVETISCQANNVGQFRQALKKLECNLCFVFLRYPIYNSLSGGYMNAYVRSALYDILIYSGKELCSHFSNSWTILSSLSCTNFPTKGRPADLYRGKISSEAAGVVFSVWEKRT